MLRFALRAFLVLAVAVAILAYTQRDRITRLLAVNSLFNEDRIIGNFTAMNTMFEFALMDGGPTTPLPIGQAMALPTAWNDFAGERRVTALVVLKNGEILHESYPLADLEEGDPAALRRISWSVAKSYLSVLMGILLEDGTIASLDDPVTTYAPDLVGTAYDGASIRNVLNMASGVTFDEDYLDFSSDINRMGRVLALGQSMDGFAAGLTETFAPPGSDWQYVSIDTHIVGMVLRGATGRSVIELVQDHILIPLGHEQPPYYVTDGYGVAFVLGGLNITTRDYARFGAMVAAGGTWNGTRIVSEDWIAQSTTATAPTEQNEIGYGYQWWIPLGSQPGQFMARGIYGQYIYIDQPRGVVIAMNSADRLFREDGVTDRNIAMLRELAEATDP